MKEDKDKSIDEMRDALARQILEIALEDDNPQLKIDVYKCTAERLKSRTAETPTAAGGMEAFQARVKQASGNNGAKPSASDT